MLLSNIVVEDIYSNGINYFLDFKNGNISIFNISITEIPLENKIINE